MIDYAPLITAAVSRGLNIIASSNDEYNFGDDLTSAFPNVEARIIHFDLQSFKPIDLFAPPTSDSGPNERVPSYFLVANVLCFTSMELVDAEMQQAIDELMEKRTLRGIEFPNLRTIIVSYDFLDSPEEIGRLQHLAPSVMIAFS